MKKIEALIRSSKIYSVKDALDEIGITGMTVYEVKGMGTQKAQAASGGRPGTTARAALNPKTKIEIVCNDSDVYKIMDTISRSAKTGSPGDGKIFVHTIEDSMRIRTGERGTDAV
jgi:nitrogen regulatory protein P-II 1